MSRLLMLLIVLAPAMPIAAGGAALAPEPAMEVSPNQISPNGDGVRDELRIVLKGDPSDVVTVRVYNSAGKLICTIADQFQLDLSETALTWEGRGISAPVPNGVYTVKTSFKGPVKAEASAKVLVQSVRKWPALNYANKPFFPVGVWFEGNPAWAGYPGDPVGAKRYYDRGFADLAAHGFDTVAVPNCPESLWETLLKSAQSRGIKVVLEVGPLAALVSEKPITEAEVYAAAKSVYAKIGNYASLIRYQIRDEPTPALVANWLLVQRILGAVDPSRPAFSCFCSSESLVSVADSATLSEAVFDIYPLGVGAPRQTLGGFPAALDAFKDAAGRNTLWAVLQAFAKPGARRYPTPEELRSMTYLSLAAGVKGVFYFIYQSMPKHLEKLEGLTDPQEAPTAMYGPASDLAKELRRLAPLLLSLKPNGPAVVQGDFRVGSFKDGSGHPVLIVASARPDVAVNVQVAVDSDAPWKDALTGESFTPQNKVLSLALSPGSGRALTLK